MIALLLLLMTALQAAASYESDAALERQFHQHKGDYEKILEMARSDGPFVRIASDFTRPDANDSSSGTQTWISRQRLAKYRALFHRIGVLDGIDKNGDGIFFANTARGFILSSGYKGIVLLPEPSEASLELFGQAPAG